MIYWRAHHWSTEVDVKSWGIIKYIFDPLQGIGVFQYSSDKYIHHNMGIKTFNLLSKNLKYTLLKIHLLKMWYWTWLFKAYKALYRHFPANVLTRRRPSRPSYDRLIGISRTISRAIPLFKSNPLNHRRYKNMLWIVCKQLERSCSWRCRHMQNSYRWNRSTTANILKDALMIPENQNWLILKKTRHQSGSKICCQSVT